MLSRTTAFLYGFACYVVFLATFLYAVGFLGNFGVPKPIDSGAHLPFLQALAINTALLGLFAVQHSVISGVGVSGRLALARRRAEPRGRIIGTWRQYSAYSAWNRTRSRSSN